MRILKPIILLVVFLSVEVLAKEISIAELGKYLKAIDMATVWKNRKCGDGSSSTIEKDEHLSWLVSYQVQGEISDDFTQPLFKFKLSSANDTSFILAEILSSPDLKRVTKENFRNYVHELVNTGTLADPVYEVIPVLKRTLLCEIY